MFRDDIALCGKPLFQRLQTQDLNDCMIYAVNSILGYPWFRCREQTMRFIKRGYHVNTNIALTKKEQGGINIHHFEKTFALEKRHNGTWDNYTLRHVVDFPNPPNHKVNSGDIRDSGLTKRNLFSTYLEGDGPNEGTGRFLIISKKRYFEVHHARGMIVTRDEKTKKVAIYDSSKQYVEYAVGGGDHKFYKRSFMDDHEHIALYELIRTISTKPDRLDFIRYFLTGKKD